MSFSSLSLLLIVVSLCCLTARTGSNHGRIHWHDNWARGCDFPGNDITQVNVRADACGLKCDNTSGCSHFVWGAVDGGTCWLKRGPVNKGQAKLVPDMQRICGIGANSGPSVSPAPISQEALRLPGEKGDRGLPGPHGEKGDRGFPGPRGEKGESGSISTSLDSTCLSPAQFNELKVTIAKEAKVIKEQMVTANSFRSNIEALTTILQQQQQQQEGRILNTTIPRVDDSAIFNFTFTPPTNVWCPWRSDSCTQKIQRPGQMTIVMEQDVPLPFELHLSTSDNPENDNYVIHLLIDLNRAVIKKTVNGRATVINETVDLDHVLYQGKHKYWLSIDHANLFVKYGQGEVRDRSTLLRSDLSNDEKNSVRRIQFVHVSFSSSRMLENYKWYEYKVKLKIGQHPVVRDPPLLVAEPRDVSVDHFINGSFMHSSRLDKPCQSLYNDIVGWKFQDDTFPYLYEAIEHSIRNKAGWCYKKLREKSSRFGASNPNATYLRITVGLNIGTSPGIPYVLEIWPPGHYSPIHAHANTYGIIRVLYGEINVKLYRTLNLKKTKPIHEATFYENQVTWLSPGLNQVHKLENKSPNKSCITIQAYEYITDEVSHYEYFDYINNNGLAIDKFEPVSDLDYPEFKELMITEWNNKQ